MLESKLDELTLTQEDELFLTEIIRKNNVFSRNGEEIINIIKQRLDSTIGDSYELEIVKGYKMGREIVNGIFKIKNRDGSNEFFVLNTHYDTVPANENWRVTRPFNPLIVDSQEGKILFGRGSNDNKGLIISGVKVLEYFAKKDINIAFMVVGDEEEGGQFGTKITLERFLEKHKVSKSMVLEPTCVEVFGDRLKVGARGIAILTFYLKGETFHSSRPHLTKHSILNALKKFIELSINTLYFPGDSEWMRGTTFGITKIETEDMGKNVTPGEIRVRIDLRYNISQTPETAADYIKSKIEEFFARENINGEISYTIDKSEHGNPFRNFDLEYENTVKEVIEEVCSITPKITTSGGSSDGRYFVENKIPYVEFGPVIHNIHSADEFVELSDLEGTSKIIVRTIEKLEKERKLYNEH